MNSRLRPLFVVSAILSLAGCDKPLPSAATAPITTETDNQLAEARDALQRQALEIETKTALMDQQFAEMEQTLKEHENAQLQDSLDALKQQNEALRAQADAARQQSDALAQRIAATPTPDVAREPVLPPDYSLFYERLAPYGRWLEVNGYGYCWRPTITVVGWRPYVDGCWVWSSLGWAWQSNEPFGWATYHYGRWLDLAGHGWVWVPGNEWAPAWVAWRQSLDSVGWAPLPPEPGVFSGVYRDCDSRYGLGPASYTFINTNQFVNTTYINVYAPVTRQTTIFQHSVNVTQMVPRHGHGHAFVNQGGPPRTQIEQACGRPVPHRQVQSMHADQIPAQQHPHGRRDAAAPVAMVEIPAVTPGAHVRHPDVREHIQRPARMSGFEGVPQRVATEIRETITRQRETAAVQQPPVPGRMPHERTRHPVEPPAVVSTPPVNHRPQETVRPATVAEPRSGRTAEPPRPTTPVAVIPQSRNSPPENQGAHHHRPSTGEQTASPEAPQMPAIVEPQAPAPSVVAAPTPEPGRTTPAAVVATPPATMPQPPAEPSSSPQHAVTETTAAERQSAHAHPAAQAENTRRHPAGEQAQGDPRQHRQRPEGQSPAMAENQAAEQATATAAAETTRQQEALAAEQRRATGQAAVETERARRHAEADAMQQRHQHEMHARTQAENRASEQAAAAAEAEKTRTQATVAAQQQAEAATQQQRMAAEQAAAATETARQLAEAAAMQQQQEQAAQQQRATAERMAADQAAAESARAQQAQTEAAAMQRQQEEATRRAAEEQQMRAQQEAAQRAAQEMAQRQAEEAARRQQEAEMQRAQEMAQRQAQEQARRAAEEQMRAQQEAAQRAAQEMAQRQAEEAARRAQAEAQRAAAEAAQRAAAEAARNQPGT